VYNLLPLSHFPWTSVVYEEKRDRHEDQASKQKNSLLLCFHMLPVY